MVRNYKPVDITAVQWNRIFRKIRLAGGVLSTIQLAKDLGVERTDAEFLKALDFLVSQDRVFISIGSYEGKICKYVHSRNEAHYIEYF